jgi:ABC-type transport system involved in multi-copper enzyme maturation permease subunit
MSHSAINKAPLYWLPLLVKELRATANRKRYYRMRGFYAFAFFAYFGYEGYTLIDNSADRLEGLGSGAAFFQKVFRFQLLATLVFIPAMVSGTIAREKERGSLPLLLITDLTPLRIILQKYFSGLAPMLAMQLTALPLGAFAYALGGLSEEDILVATALLWAHTFHATAFSVACSAWCRNSRGALLTTFLGSAALMSLLAYYHSPRVAFDFPVPASPVDRHLQMSLGITFVCLSLVYLIFATLWLRRRADPHQEWGIFKFTNVVDRYFRKFYEITTGVRLPKRTTLPGRQPVRWRELRKRALARPQTLVVVVAVVSVFCVIGFVALMMLNSRALAEKWRSGEFTAAVYVVWSLIALLATVQGANIVVSERIHQTLDILLTTPLRGRDIILEKASVARNLGLVVLTPLVALHFLQSFHWSVTGIQLRYLLFALVGSIVLPAFIFWLAVTVGLHFRSKLPAAVAALFLLFVLCVAPFARPEHKIRVLSPASPIVLNETAWDPANRPRWQSISFVQLPLIISLGGMAIATFGMRTYCLFRADRLLGRGR